MLHIYANKSGLTKKMKIWSNEESGNFDDNENNTRVIKDSEISLLGKQQANRAQEVS